LFEVQLRLGVQYIFSLSCNGRIAKRGLVYIITTYLPTDLSRVAFYPRKRTFN